MEVLVGYGWDGLSCVGFGGGVADVEDGEGVAVLDGRPRNLGVSVTGQVISSQHRVRYTYCLRKW